ATSRSLGLVNEHARMEEAARQATSLLATAAVASLAGHEARLVAGERKAAETRLLQYLPQDRLDEDAFLLLVNPAGKVFGGIAAGPYIGQRLTSLLPEMAALRRFNGTGLIETSIGEEPHYAAIHSLGKDGGLVVAAHSLASIQSFWRPELSLNV